MRGGNLPSQRVKGSVSPSGAASKTNGGLVGGRDPTTIQKTKEDATDAPAKSAEDRGSTKKVEASKPSLSQSSSSAVGVPASTALDVDAKQGLAAAAETRTAATQEIDDDDEPPPLEV